jgi:poly(hydroxyalkanoate) depolymerase family esterase
MNALRYRDMLEATRLTRAGQLAGAVSLLQRLLQGNTPTHTSFGTSGEGVEITTASASHTIELVPETIDVTDTIPFSRTGRRLETAADSRSGRKMEAMLPRVPEAMRSFLERVNTVGSEPASRGPVTRSPAPTPELIPSGGQFLAGSYSDEAGSRRYKVYVPSGDRGQARPLVVMLHGCTQSPDDFAAGTRMNMLAEEHACFVVYPEQSTSANFSKCWNWFSARDQQRGQGEPSLIAGITRQIMREYSVDPRRVYIAGLSAGAAAAAIMAITYPDLYAAIGVHSGLACGAASDLPSAFVAMRQGGTLTQRGADKARGATQYRQIVPTIVFHGDQDTVVNPCNGDQVIAQSKASAMGFHTSVQHGQVPGGHTYSQAFHADASGFTILEQWVIHGAGHAWSGGGPAGSYTDPLGPDASREMLRFFLEHPLPPSRAGIAVESNRGS